MITLLTPEALDRGARELAAADPHLADVFERLGTPPMWAREPGFATLIHIILEQQVSLKAALTMYRRLCEFLGGMSPQAVVNAGEAGLKSIGFTRQKARYCVALANQVHSGQLNLSRLETLDDREGRKALLAVPGLGPWSVDIYYLMALRRPDIWPQGDLALAIALQDIKGLNAPATREEQARFSESWSPWRSVAARIVWMHYLVARGDDPWQA
jgi:DNA-3-methyladenine glycosylase II